VLLNSGILSCMTSAEAETWWTKGSSAENPQVARIVNRVNHPFLISDTKVGRVISLSYLLESKVQFQLKPKCHTCQINFSSTKPSFELPTGDSTLFLYKPSDEMLNQSQQMQDYTTEVAYQPARLWQLSKIN
jgi:uncharacterized membrane protein